MISSGLAFHVKGAGFWLCSATKRLMASWRSAREWNTPRLSRRRVSVAKNPSTALSHEDVLEPNRYVAAEKHGLGHHRRLRPEDPKTHPLDVTEKRFAHRQYFLDISARAPGDAETDLHERRLLDQSFVDPVGGQTAGGRDRTPQVPVCADDSRSAAKMLDNTDRAVDRTWDWKRQPCGQFDGLKKGNEKWSRGRG